MTSLAFDLGRIAKALAASGADGAAFNNIAVQLCAVEENSVSSDVLDAVAKAGAETTPENALKVVDASKLPITGEAANTATVLAAARAASSNPLVDPASQRFWFSAFGATAQDVPLNLFFEKFLSFFEEESEEAVTKCREELDFTNSVLKPVRHALVGNGERVTKATLQDFLDTSAEYCLPDAILNLAGSLAATLPPLCQDMQDIIASTNIQNRKGVERIVQDHNILFLDYSKLSTARAEQRLKKFGLSEVEAQEVSLGIYMRHRRNLSNEVEIRTKVDQALDDMKNQYTTIDLRGCNLTSLSAVKDALLGEFNGIEHLDLGCNNLHAAGVADVVQVIKHQTKLKSLSLSGNNIQTSGIKTIVTALSSHPSVTSLDVSVCHGGPQAAAFLGENLKATKVQHLGCSGNDFGAAGASHIAALLSSNYRLLSLSLDSNHIGDAGAAHIAGALATNESLTSLNLANNNIGDDGVNDLAPTLKSHRSLQMVDLSHNWFSAAAVDAVSSTITARPGLSVLMRGFSESDVAELQKQSEANVKKRAQMLKDLSAKPLPMWSGDDVFLWSHWKLGRLDLAQRLKSVSYDGAKIRSCSANDLAKDGLGEAELQAFVFKFQETLSAH